MKRYLLKLFLDGEETGNKYDPVVVASNLKSSRGLDGTQLFPATDWLSAQQVASYFSRLATLARSGRLEKLTLNTKTILEKEDIVDAFVEREQRESMGENVFRDVD